MNRGRYDIFDAIEGLEAVDPRVIEEFERTMSDEVIPEIVRVVGERNRLAAEIGNGSWLLN